MTEDAAEDDDGEFPLLKLDEEDAPRLAVLERAELMDGLHLHRVLVLEAQVSGLLLEREVVEAVFPERPVEFGFEVADELREGFEGAEMVSGGGHEKDWVARVRNAEFYVFGLPLLTAASKASRGIPLRWPVGRQNK